MAFATEPEAKFQFRPVGTPTRRKSRAKHQEIVKKAAGLIMPKMPHHYNNPEFHIYQEVLSINKSRAEDKPVEFKWSELPKLPRPDTSASKKGEATLKNARPATTKPRKNKSEFEVRQKSISNTPKSSTGLVEAHPARRKSLIPENFDVLLDTASNLIGALGLIWLGSF